MVLSVIVIVVNVFVVIIIIVVIILFSVFIKIPITARILKNNILTDSSLMQI